MSKDIYNELLSEDIVKEIDKRLAKPYRSIKDHTEDLLEVLDLLWKLGYIKEERIYNLTKMACIYHDIGKINNEFQKRIRKTSLKFDENKEAPHNVLSLYFIDENKFEHKDDYLRVANAVINHHDYCDVSSELREKKEIIQNLIEEFEYKNVKKTTPARISRISQDIDAIKIKGYLHKCDYNASSKDKNGNKEYEAEYINNFLEKSLDNLMTKWKNKNQNSKWNDLQNFCIKNQDKNIITIAQTGMGKTEAGLLWMGNNKGFFILPIRTAINAIFDRIKNDILNGEEINKRLGLLHSSSLEYLLNQNENKDNDNIEDKESYEILNYENTAKQLSLPINISTLDQLFDFVYKYPAYELKLTTLSYSKVVIDEIQMYGPDLLAYLIYGIERIVEQGGKVAILTATLPPFVKDLLSENIKFEVKEFTDSSKRHNLKVFNERINADYIYNKYNENEELGKSNKILVVCNSITEAQNIYEQLEEKMNNKENIHILHSKFIKSERLEKEKEIINFGKTYKDYKSKELDKQSGIWISTSIVEASLDIDFDYLFTELQDINSLFQRLGRCNRKGKKDSSESNCFIYTDIDEKSFINGDKGYIDEEIFNLSKEAISSVNGQISEQDKIKLINKYMTMENIKDSIYLKEYKDTYNFIKDLSPGEFKLDEVKLRNILSKDIIPGPVYKIYLEEIKDLESQLKDKSLNSKDNKKNRIELQEKLRKYTVSIHPSHISTTLKNEKSLKYSDIRLSDYEYIKVLDCEYDEKGYKKKNFNDQNYIGDVDDFIF